MPKKSAFQWRNLVVWLAGFIIYRILMQVDTPVGNTLPDMVITVILCLIVEKSCGGITQQKKRMKNEETEFKEIDGHSNLSSGSSGGKLVFLPGIRFQMRTGTAPGKCFMRRYRRTMVGAGTGFLLRH